MMGTCTDEDRQQLGSCMRETASKAKTRGSRIPKMKRGSESGKIPCAETIRALVGFASANEYRADESIWRSRQPVGNAIDRSGARGARAAPQSDLVRESMPVDVGGRRARARVAAAAQEDLPGDAPGWTGLTEAEEIIEARRVLMIRTEELMLPIDEFAAGVGADGETLRAAAETIEAMLLALPHLFPPTTDRYEPDTLEPETRALPDIWRDFAAFRAMAAAAEEAAAALADAEDEQAARAAALRLRGTCDGCHARFAKPYTPPKVTEEDLSFDFDSVFPDD